MVQSSLVWGEVNKAEGKECIHRKARCSRKSSLSGFGVGKDHSSQRPGLHSRGGRRRFQVCGVTSGQRH